MDLNKILVLDKGICFAEAFEGLKNTEAKYAVIKELGKRILLQRYFEELQINSDNSNLDPENLLKKFCTQYRLSTPEEFERFLEKINQSKESFIETLIYEEKVRLLKKQIITSHSINDLFLEKKMRQDSVLFSLIRVEKEIVAREIYYRLKHDLMDFGLLAKQFSNGNESKYGGLVGPISLQTLNPELRSRLISMQEGDVSEPFSIDGDNYLVLKLIRVDRIALNNQIENNLRDELFEQWINRQLELQYMNGAGKTSN